MCVVITFSMTWLSFVVEEFWALMDNIITVAMAMLLREDYYVHVLQSSTLIITSI